MQAPVLRARETPLVLCDGSDRLRFTIQLPASNVGTDDLVLWELGGRFLFVQGDCRYWVSAPDSPSLKEHYHTGTLTEPERATLEQKFFYGQWEARGLIGSWLRAQGHFDVTSMAFRSPEGGVYCDGGCGAESNPEEVHQMRGAEQPMIEQLWNSGAAYGGALRLQVILNSGVPGPNATWPLSWPISDILVAGEALEYLQPGISTLIDDAEEVAVLRAIWDEYLSGAHGENWWNLGGIPFEDPRVPGEDFFAYMRDILPFEEENGLVNVSF